MVPDLEKYFAVHEQRDDKTDYGGTHSCFLKALDNYEEIYTVKGFFKVLHAHCEKPNFTFIKMFAMIKYRFQHEEHRVATVEFFEPELELVSD